MPRGARFCPAGLPAHIIQRGNNRQAIFTSYDDLAAYAHWMSEGARRFFLMCLRYIEMNPVRAGMVKDPGDYRWSSYRAHAFGVNVGLWTPHNQYLDLAFRGVNRE